MRYYLTLIAISVLIGVLTGCSHMGIQKNCGEIDSSKYEKWQNKSACDSLWFWE